MKRSIFILAAAMAAACQMETLESPQTTEGEPFSIRTSFQSTRTTLDTDGWKVSWDEDDALSVIAVYTDGTVRSYRFDKGDGDTFSCPKVYSPEEIEALNVFYPYDENQYAMDGDYGRAGMSFGTGVQQAAVNDASHINGPLYGYTEPDGGTGQVTMHHASTLFDIQVVNSSDEDILITEVMISTQDGDKNLTGWFKVNPETGDVEPASAYKEATLPVNEVTVSAGQTGHFYITTAPFELARGKTFTVTVTANGIKYEFDKNVESDETGKFAAGTVNHVRAEFSEVQEVDPNLTVSIEPSYLAPVAESGEFTINVTSTGDWTAVPETGIDDWLEIDVASGSGNGTVTVKLKEIAGGDSEVRTGTVTFRAGVNSAILTVQHGYAMQIGNLIWAKANVGESGRFASSPDDPGMLYQYASNVAWTNNYPDDDYSNGITSGPEGYPTGAKNSPQTWPEDQDPCPEGWRVPTADEVTALMGTDTDNKFGWLEPSASSFGAPGVACGLAKETAKAATKDNMAGCIFLPCSGNRAWKNGLYQNPTHVTIQSSTIANVAGNNDGNAYRYVVKIMGSDTNFALPSSPENKWGYGELNMAYSVRCVADNQTEEQ